MTASHLPENVEMQVQNLDNGDAAKKDVQMWPISGPVRRQREGRAPHLVEEGVRCICRVQTFSVQCFR